MDIVLINVLELLVIKDKFAQPVNVSQLIHAQVLLAQLD
jgi:hypothetical protein